MKTHAKKGNIGRVNYQKTPFPWFGNTPCTQSYSMVECEQPVGWIPQAALTTSSLKGGSAVADSDCSLALREYQLIVAAHENAVAAGRFWAKVRKSDSGCWEWTAAKTEKGYGVVGIAGDTFKAHRVTYMLARGPIPDGMCALHSCDNPACVNPDHLFLGTKADNNRDMCAKGRHWKGRRPRTVKLRLGFRRGESHHNAKLTNDEVNQLRAERATQGTSFSKLAAKYGIVISHAWRIVNHVQRK